MKTRLTWLFCLLVCNSGCNRQPAPDTTHLKSSSRFSAVLYAEFYSRTAAVQSQLLTEQMKILHDAVTTFLAEPGPDTLHSAQLGWLETHRSFLKASFYSPVTKIGSAATGLPAAGTGSSSPMIDTWPIQEGFLDSLQHYPTSGIINDLTISIDEQTLRNQHGITDSEEVSLGFHAIEFLLWARPITDFTEQHQLTTDQSSDGLSLDQLSNNRRRKTLQLISKLLYEDIVSQYQPPRGDDQRPQSAATFSLQEAIHACSMSLQNIREELLLNPGDGASGHSRFSQSSVQDLLTYARTLAHVYAAPGRLKAGLRETGRPEGGRTETGRPEEGRLQQLFESLDPILADQFSVLLSAILQILSELTDSALDRSTLLKLNSSLDLMIDHCRQYEILLEY